MTDRFLFTTIAVADEDKVEKLKDNLGRPPEDDEVELSYAEMVIDLLEVEAVRQSFKDTEVIQGEACVYLLGETFFVRTPYDEVLRAWLNFKEDKEDRAPSQDVGQAVATLARALDEDKSEGSLYYGYQSNIAMNFIDAWVAHYGKTRDRPGHRDEVQEIANDGARRFLDMLIGSTK